MYTGKKEKPWIGKELPGFAAEKYGNF